MSFWAVTGSAVFLLLVSTAHAAVNAHEIRHSEALKFKGAVEGVIYHSEGAAFKDRQRFLAALEADPRQLKAGGRALLAEWRVYLAYDTGHLFRIRAPHFWRHDWQKWKHWQRLTLSSLHRAALDLLADDWHAFTRAKARGVRAERSRDASGRRMHLALGGGG